jgi:putative two-component system response regulator
MWWGTWSARCWPYTIVATAFVTALPAYLATLVTPSGSALGVVATLLLALALSLAAAKVGAALWMRHPLARDVLFADLMVWEWLRRIWVEHRLTRAHRLLGAADGAPHARADALRRLARLLEARDAYTAGHSQRVARHALRIAGELHVPAADTARIWTAATLHDIGKIHAPRAVLNKSGRLTDVEFEVIKRHPVDGAAMLAGIGDPQLVAVVRSHHERLDGAGYPDGLTGTEIPLGARIIAVADTFDALTSTRSYRSPATHKRALDILRKEAGAQLDDAAVAAFLRTYSGRRPATWSALFTLGPPRLLSWLGHQATSAAGLAPAAGWVAPAAAAAAVLVGASSHATGAATGPPAGRTATAEVRSASSASAPRLVAPGPGSVKRSRGTVPALKDHEHQQPRRRRPSPATPAGGARTPEHNTAASLSGPASSATPAGSEPSAPTTTADDTVAAAKALPMPSLPHPGLNPQAPPVALPPLPIPAVALPPLPIPAVALPPLPIPAVTGAVAGAVVGAAQTATSPLPGTIIPGP